MLVYVVYVTIVLVSRVAIPFALVDRVQNLLDKDGIVGVVDHGGPGSDIGSECRVNSMSCLLGRWWTGWYGQDLALGQRQYLDYRFSTLKRACL
jgi:hypothetical protein